MSSTQVVLTLATQFRSVAHTLAGVLSELIEPAPSAVSIHEIGAGWQVDAYLDEAPPSPDAFVAELLDISGIDPGAGVDAVWSDVPAENWVAISQAALPPVEAGRFTVHGAHDNHRIPRGRWSIEIDAGEAFGTAHHATTYGCLRALDRLDEIAPRSVLDLGTGSGVLAIACARLWPRSAIVASDIDGDSVRIARENSRKNERSPAAIACIECDGVPRGAAARKRFDLIIANILAGPLIGLAGNLAASTECGGFILLSGILNRQSRAVIAAYGSHGCRVVSHDRYEGWSTLVLRRTE